MIPAVDPSVIQGERAQWAKYSTVETATRIPLIVRLPPSMMSNVAVGGRKSSALIEIVDIGPTLLDLVSGKVPPLCAAAVGNTSSSEPDDCMEGNSFKALLSGGDDALFLKAAAFSQVHKDPCCSFLT